MDKDSEQGGNVPCYVETKHPRDPRLGQVMPRPSIPFRDIPGIRFELQEGVKATLIAKRYGVSPATIRRIGKGATYPQLGGPIETKDRRKIVALGANNNNAVLLPEQVIQIRELLSDGKPVEALAERYGVSTSTISKLHTRETWSPAYNSCSRVVRSYDLSSLEGLDRDVRVSRALRIVKESGFPYRAHPRHSNLISAIRRVRGSDTSVSEFTLSSSRTGERIATSYHPHLERVSCNGRPSPFDIFLDHDRLKRVISQLLDENGALTPTRIRRGIEDATRVASNFRPVAALSIYRLFGATSVLDPCMGWGGRMMAAMSDMTPYTGIDPSSYAIAGNQRLLDDASATAGTTFPVEIIKGCAEQVLFDRDFSVDLVFTSPPYFDTEKYSDEPTQSYRRYPRLDTWLSRFLRPLIEGSYLALVPGGHLVLNVSEKLVEHVVRYATELKFIQLQTLNLGLPVMPYRRRNSSEGVRHEPVLVFKRPELGGRKGAV